MRVILVYPLALVAAVAGALLAIFLLTWPLGLFGLGVPKEGGWRRGFIVSIREVEGRWWLVWLLVRLLARAFGVFGAAWLVFAIFRLPMAPTCAIVLGVALAAKDYSGLWILNRAPIELPPGLRARSIVRLLAGISVSFALAFPF